MKSGLLGTSLAAALFAGSLIPAHAAVLKYDFFGVGTGTLGGSAFSGDFTVSLTGNTANITSGGGEYFLVAPGTFTTGATSVAFTGGASEIISNASSTFPAEAFGQPVPGGFSAEGVVNSAFIGYDLTTAFPLTGGDVSFLPQTFTTSGGDLSFTGISSLSFQAVSGVPEPSTWAMMIVGLGALGLTRFRKKSASLAVA
jgi:hypothetical protein